MQAKQLLKIIISLFLHTSLQSPPPPLFLAFLWTKFICTETAQRFPFFLRRKKIILSSSSSLKERVYNIPLLQYYLQIDNSISDQTGVYWKAFLAYLLYYYQQHQKAAKMDPIHIKKEKY